MNLAAVSPANPANKDPTVASPLARKQFSLLNIDASQARSMTNALPAIPNDATRVRFLTAPYSDMFFWRS
jgi:hypothetical protein